MAVSDPLSRFSMTGKRFVIVGALGTLGRLAAHTLQAAGAHVFLVDGETGALSDLQAELTTGGSARTGVFGGFIRTTDDASAMADQAVAALGGIDGLIVTAGSNKAAPIVEMTIDDWESVMDTNVKVAWLACQAVGRVMIAQKTGGKVVLLSSTRGRLGHPAGYTAYVPAKHAVEGLVRTLACEWGAHGINVNGLGPTVFRSALSDWMFAEEGRGREVREGMLGRIPLGRLAEADDLAGALMFLSSAASDFCTGQILYIDGGYTAG